MARQGEILAATGCKPVDLSSAFRLKKKADFPKLSSYQGPCVPNITHDNNKSKIFLKESLTL